MKISEKFIDLEGNKFGVLETFDNEPYLEHNQKLRSAGVGKLPESWCVGSIPMHVLAQWMREENVSWQDQDGMNKLIMRKLNDPEFKKLRIVEGRL